MNSEKTLAARSTMQVFQPQSASRHVYYDRRRCHRRRRSSALFAKLRIFLYFFSLQFLCMHLSYVIVTELAPDFNLLKKGRLHTPEGNSVL